MNSFYVKIFLVLFLVTPLFSHAHTEGVITITMTPEGFSPSEVEIFAGDTVVFENADTRERWPASNIHPTHELYSEFDPLVPVASGESWGFTFERVGTWRMHDHLIPSMKGKIVVNERDEHFEEALDSEQKPSQVLQKRNFALRIVDALKEFFLGLFGRSTSTVSSTRDVDRGISRDSISVFSDPDALFSYVKKYGPSEAVSYLYANEAQYGDCHNNAHEVGRAAYELSGIEAFQSCSAQCHSGCYHGATEGFFRDNGVQDLVNSMEIICNSELNPFFSHQCVHGIGHGLMAWSDYELIESLQNCDLLPSQHASCYSGVYMENVVGGLAPDQGHFTQFLSEDPHFPCNIVPEKYKNACYFYQTSRMVQIFNGDFAQVASTCGEADTRYQRSCFESMGRDVGGRYRGDELSAIAACGTAPHGDARIWCLSGAVQDAFWTPQGQTDAISFCKALHDTEEKDVCYNTIFGRAPQVLESPKDLRAFCDRAEEAYQQQCLSSIR